MHRKYIAPINNYTKKAIRLICKKGALEHTAPLFQQEKILPISFMIDLNALTFIFDYIHKNLPPSFDETWQRIEQVNNRYNLRNNDNFRLPNIRYFYLDKHPLFNFPKLYNNLNEEIKQINNRFNFVVSLKSYFLQHLTR